MCPQRTNCAVAAVATMAAAAAISLGKRTAGRAKSGAIRCPKIAERDPLLEDDFGRAVSRILSAPVAGGENHLSQRPIPGTRPACANRGAGRSGVSYLALHPMGFSVPRRLLFERWALTPPFHPYHAPLAKRRAVCFLWHCPSGRLAASPPACIPASCVGPARLRGIAPCGVRTFLLPRLAPGAILRPSKITVNIPGPPAATRLGIAQSPGTAFTPSPTCPYPACSRGCDRSWCRLPVPSWPGT